MTEYKRYIPKTKRKIKHLNDGFYYELWMVTKAVKVHHDLIGEIPVISNMCIEAVTVHTRTLLEFFNNEMLTKVNNKGWQHISKANDYMKKGQKWITPDIENDKRYKHLKKLKKRVNPEVVHLSYDRLIHKKTDWDLDAVLNELSIIIQEFMAKCDKKYIKKDLRHLVKEGLVQEPKYLSKN